MVCSSAAFGGFVKPFLVVSKQKLASQNSPWMIFNTAQVGWCDYQLKPFISLYHLLPSLRKFNCY